MRYGVLLATFALSACAAPEPVFKPVTVDIPITAPCPAPAIAPPETNRVPASAPLFEKVKNTLAEMERRKAYEAQLIAALQACRQPPT